MKTSNLLAVALLLGDVVALSADSAAYVVASSSNQGSIVPVHTTNGTFGAAYFVPVGGHGMVISPGGGQIWQATEGLCYESCAPYGVSVLDAKTRSTLGTISMAGFVASLVINPASTYAYACLGYPSSGIVEIDVASRTIVQTGGPSSCGGMTFSTDGSKLFVGSNSVLVLDPQTLATIATLPVSGSPFVSGPTLLVTTSTQMFYFDTATLQQTNVISIPSSSYLFGVAPDRSKTYFGADCGCGSASIYVLDFSTGQTLASQTYTNVGEFNSYLFFVLSPDGSQIAITNNLVLLIDSATLATNKTFTPFAVPTGAVFLDSNDLLLAYSTAAAMMVVDQATAQVTATYPLGVDFGLGEVADRNAGLIYVGGGSTGYLAGSNVSVVNAKLGRVVQNLLADGMYPAALAGTQLYGGPLVFNLGTGVLASLPYPTAPAPLFTWFLGACPPNGQTYWTPFMDSYRGGKPASSGVAVYDTATNTLTTSFSIPLHSYNPIVFSPDSSTAYIGEPNAIAVYDTATFQNTANYSYTTTFVSMLISPNGSFLYANNGKAVFVLDAATGAQRRRIELPAEAQYSIALSPDGTTMYLLESGANAMEFLSTTTGQVTVVSLPYMPSSVAALP